MADKNTSKNIDNEPEESVGFPQTWDELKAVDGYADLPDMVQANEFTPSQSILFSVASGRVTARWQKLIDMGAFAGDGKYDEEEAMMLMAEGVEYANSFFETIADDKKTYDEWVKGRTVGDLFGIFLVLVRFYGDQLGKSAASKLH